MKLSPVSKETRQPEPVAAGGAWGGAEGGVDGGAEGGLGGAAARVWR